MLARGFKTAILCAAIITLTLPAWADDIPSLEDLVKGRAGAAPVEQLPSRPLPEVSLPGTPSTPISPVMPAPESTLQGEAQDRGPLQGQVDTAGAAPAKKKKPLEASIQEQELNSAADKQDGDLKGLNPQLDKQGRPLNGNANTLDSGLASQDPDMDDQEMAVEWDKWHNRVLNAIQQGLIEQLQSTGDNVMLYDPRTGRMRSKYPLGTMAMFSCQVTPDHRIVNLRIDQPSGFQDYDRAVYQAVKVLEGSSILRYPKGSHRKIVFEAAGIRTSMQSGPANFHWGDTERYRVPAGQSY